ANCGRARAAAQLLGAAEALCTQTGAALGGPTIPVVAAAKQMTLEALGIEALAAQFEAGQHLSREAALRLALVEAPAVDASPEAFAVSPLAKRELEVARLV